MSALKRCFRFLVASGAFLLTFSVFQNRSHPGKSCGRCDHKLWAGAAAVKITPVVEPFEDLNKNKKWNKGEPFQDLNGNGAFDPVWLAGFGTGRTALGVHDDLWARALYLERDGKPAVVVSLDLVGYLAHHVRNTKNVIQERMGIPPEQVIICSTHTHSGPDTFGRWGADFFSSGLNQNYMAFLQESIVQAVEQAKKTAVPSLAAFAREEAPDIPFIQKPDDIPAGEIDIVRDGGGIGEHGRDPDIVDRNLLVMQVREEKTKNTVATVVNFSMHPEMLWDRNRMISSDFPHYVRETLEQKFGGIAIYFSGALGGMMTPNVSANTFEEAHRIAVLLSDRVVKILSSAKPSPVKSFSLFHTYAFFPIDNREMVDMAIKYKIVDVTPDRFVYTYENCKDKYACKKEEVAACVEEVKSMGEIKQKGCAPILIQLLKLDEASFVTVPGELFPELANGLPPDFKEFEPKNTRPNKYFPKHNEKDPLSQHADPYIVPKPVRKILHGKYKFILGLANHEGGYVIPEADFMEGVSSLKDGDHYEETASALGRRGDTILLSKIEELENKKSPH